MGYFQPADQGSVREAINLGAAQHSERTASLTGLGHAAQRSSMQGVQKLDRVTLSSAADALAQTNAKPGAASPQRLDVLREAIRASSMPIYPKAIAAAILCEEGQVDASESDADHSMTSLA